MDVLRTLEHENMATRFDNENLVRKKTLVIEPSTLKLP